MSRSPNRFKQIDVARAIRAAQQTGAGAVRVLPNGAIEIDTKPMGDNQPNVVDDGREIVL
jgi:hypothetical protein